MHNIFKELGMSENQIEKILNSPRIKELKSDTILKNLKNIIIVFHDNDFNKQLINEIINKAPTILTNDSNTIYIKINDLKNLGFTNIKGILKKNPKVLTLNIKNSVNNKINDIQNIGFSHQEVIKLVEDEGTILNYSVDKIKDKINKLSTVIPYQEVLNLITKFPNIICRDEESIREKLFLCKEAQFLEIVLDKPMSLTQSIQKTYARAKFLRSKSDGFIAKDIFRDTEKFKRKYNISDDFLNEQFKYDDSPIKESYNKKFK